MEYRKAGKDDVAQLVELRKKQLVDEGACADSNIDAALAEYFSSSLNNKNLVVWLAIEGRQIIGTAGVCFFQYPPNFTNTTGKVAYITNVYTKNEFRNQGTATKLLEFIMEEIKLEGCIFVRLHASAQGKKLYERLGFEDAHGFMTKKCASLDSRRGC